ncbi:MAG: hypothetical protein AAF611_08500 [Bacteroidota bacterium]
MKPNKTYLKGKSVFIVSLVVIVVTALTVYLSGINYHRSITNNFHLSLGIIAIALLSFLSYGLYKGIELEDDYPALKGFKFKKKISELAKFESSPHFDFDMGEGIGGIILAIVLWLFFSVVLIALLVFLQSVVWFSILLILAMLYWLFFRALRLVFSKGADTENNVQLSFMYAFSYTILYIGWLFGIVYLTTILN